MRPGQAGGAESNPAAVHAQQWKVGQRILAGACERSGGEVGAGTTLTPNSLAAERAPFVACWVQPGSRLCRGARLLTSTSGVCTNSSVKLTLLSVEMLLVGPFPDMEPCARPCGQSHAAGPARLFCLLAWRLWAHRCQATGLNSSRGNIVDLL